ncbi:hypothetical protein LF887_18780 [Chryseobacterium sp. MEBOG06]|uniref:hypothetical protein n=1 Tax=Chryseobacterium sp. MEBOG06 TaxID=2879938 RepID=UPI001F2081F8|nr:hypothetical protein [Chryseobacterium sp. MEBOG06]UKB83037.1 hypothetical protein LF887_18780 [Chryseobacterium sp. MEBOG06]
MMIKQKQNFKYLLFLFFFLFSMKGFAANYYWVGGSGNWSDISHWRTSSGGSGIPLVVPGQTDDVFFDVNSGFTAASKTVTVNVPANMRDITFSGSAVAPIFKSVSTANPINIYGSSVWQAGMEISSVYIYYRNSNSPKTITSNGVSIGTDNVYFEEVTSMSLLDDFSVSGKITHSAGTFNTNNHNVTAMSYFGDIGGNPRTLNIGSSDFYITGPMYDGNFSADSPVLTINAGTSHIHFTGVTGYPSVKPYAGQHYHYISFEKPGLEGNLGYDQTGKVYYNRITMKGNGKLIKDNEIGELVLAEGKTYTLDGSAAQTVTTKLSAHIPDCGERMSISSSTAGIQAKLIAAPGVTIDVSGVMLKDIQASGGAQFIALESADNGNNTGWTFPASPGKTLYWVGGSGNWNDRTHWSATSGGTGGYCVPGPKDDVFFNTGSGFTSASKTITVNAPANMRNITFAGSTVPPVFKSASTLNPINIYGSSEWQTGMEVWSVYMYYRNTNTPKTIISNGVSIRVDDVYFEEEASISLVDDYALTFGTLWHNAGVFTTNNHKVLVGGYNANSGSKPRTLNLGSSEFTVTSINSGIFSATSTLLTLNAGTSHIRFTGNGNCKLLPYAGQHYYNVTFENNGTATLGYFNPTGKVYYNRVEFKDDGILVSDNEFRELLFAEDKTYSLEAGKTQMVATRFSAHPSTCGGQITIASSSAGTQAKLEAASGTVIDVSGAVIKDINASGGAVFTAVQSVDNGNNTGWIFPASAAKTLYWVGGSGNWNDVTHWSLSSSGSGGACVPGPKDDVFFDVNSGFTAAGKTVTVNVPANMRDITFSGSAVAPIFKSVSTANPINIYGSSVWQAGMEMSSVYIYYRNSNSPKTITSNGVSIGTDNVYFEEVTSMSLLDNFSVSGKITHSAGTFNTNNHNVTAMSYFGDIGGNPRTLNIGSSDFYITGPMYDGNFSADSPVLTINAGTSHIHFTGVTGYPSVKPYAGQHYHYISFEKPGLEGNLGYDQTGKVYYNRITMKGNGKLIKDNEIGELVLAEGKTYTLDGSAAQTVTTKLSAHIPDCGERMSISSSTAGIQAKLIAAPGVTIDVSGVMLKDIQASGGAQFIALESADNGNNTGWTFPASPGKTLYWVGGSGNWNDRTHWSATSGGTGGYCVPGPKDDVFFNTGSGFTSASKTITVNAPANMRNITFAGSTVPPVFKSASTLNPINIYGSSEWQTGMEVWSVYMYYRNTNTPKTIISNGVSIRVDDVYFEEEASISLVDDYALTFGTLWHNAGVFTTNNHKVLVGGYNANSGSKPRTLNLGSSEFTVTSINSGVFSATSTLLTLNAGTSHIRFTGNGSCQLLPYAGQQYHNVTFENNGSAALGDDGTGTVGYNTMTLKGNTIINGDNQFKELILTGAKKYTLQAGKTQKVTEQLYANGSACYKLEMVSSVPGTKALLNVEAGASSFDFANIKDIDASGIPLHFGAKSSDGGNNTNMSFAPYDPGLFSGFAGQDWSCTRFNNTDPASYTLSSAGFFGNPTVQYEWTKLNDPAHTGVISTEDSLDMRPYGLGTYHLKVIYSTAGPGESCSLEESVTVGSCIPSMINPGLPIRNY